MKSRNVSVPESLESTSVAVGKDIFNKSDLLDRIGGRSDLLPRLLSLFLANVDDILVRLDGVIAGMDSVEARKLSHTLKGVAANMGAERMCAVSVKLEAFAGKEELAKFAEEMHYLRAEYELFKSVVQSRFLG